MGREGQEEWREKTAAWSGGRGGEAMQGDWVMVFKGFEAAELRKRWVMKVRMRW